LCSLSAKFLCAASQLNRCERLYQSAKGTTLPVGRNRLTFRPLARPGRSCLSAGVGTIPCKLPAKTLQTLADRSLCRLSARTLESPCRPQLVQIVSQDPREPLSTAARADCQPSRPPSDRVSPKEQAADVQFSSRPESPPCFKIESRPRPPGAGRTPCAFCQPTTAVIPSRLPARTFRIISTFQWVAAVFPSSLSANTILRKKKT